MFSSKFTYSMIMDLKICMSTQGVALPMIGLETCTRILITGTHLDIIVESYEKLLRVHMENSIEIQRPTCGKISNSILHIEDWPSGYGQPSRLHHGRRASTA